jgi:antitoxin (DNA-binding transcriptional repressor) of toxin-antitoxin stability system
MDKMVDIRAAKTQLSRLVERAAKGEIKIAADFDSPLPEEILRQFEGR